MSPERHFIEDRQEKIVKGEPWNRFFNPLVMEVFSDYHRERGHLFGITGDLDNLGFYVARRGRAAAENLVDLYNQVIRNYLESWAVENCENLNSLAFVPSGEEILAVGVAKDEEPPKNLFSNIREGVMALMRDQNYIDISDTAASFGGVIFSREHDELIGKMVDTFNQNAGDEAVYPLYLRLLGEMRGEMAMALDRQKFKDVLEGVYPVELRQIVYARMLRYKQTTKKIIEELGFLSKEEAASILALVGDAYGIAPGDEEAINQAVSQLLLTQDRLER